MVEPVELRPNHQPALNHRKPPRKPLLQPNRKGVANSTLFANSTGNLPEPKATGNAAATLPIRAKIHHYRRSPSPASLNRTHRRLCFARPCFAEISNGTPIIADFCHPKTWVTMSLSPADRPSPKIIKFHWLNHSAVEFPHRPSPMLQKLPRSSKKWSKVKTSRRKKKQKIRKLRALAIFGSKRIRQKRGVWKRKKYEKRQKRI